MHETAKEVVIVLMTADPAVSMDRMVEITSMNRGKVEKAVFSLKKKGLVACRGGTRGVWEVPGQPKNNVPEHEESAP